MSKKRHSFQTNDNLIFALVCLAVSFYVKYCYYKPYAAFFSYFLIKLFSSIASNRAFVAALYAPFLLVQIQFEFFYNFIGNSFHCKTSFRGFLLFLVAIIRLQYVLSDFELKAFHSVEHEPRRLCQLAALFENLSARKPVIRT